MTSVTLEGEESGIAVGDVVITANFNRPVFVTNKTVGLLTTFFLGAFETEGMLEVELKYGELMRFNDGEGILLVLELIKRL